MSNKAKHIKAIAVPHNIIVRLAMPIHNTAMICRSIHLKRSVNNCFHDGLSEMFVIFDLSIISLYNNTHPL